MNVRRIYRVVLSSTFIELEDKRREVIQLMGRHDLHGVAMENRAAMPTLGKKASSLQMVEIADAYIGIIAYRYGSRVPPEGLSLTELEWRRAKERGIPCCFLLMSPRYPIPMENLLAVSTEDRESLARLRRQVEEEVVCAPFSDDTEFTVNAMQSLEQLRYDLDVRHQVRAPARTGSAALPADTSAVELLCDRSDAAKGFEDLLLNRQDPLRPGCLILFGEDNQAHAEFIDRIRAYTLGDVVYQRLFRVPAYANITTLQNLHRNGREISEEIIRSTAKQLKGDPRIRRFPELYLLLKRRKLALCLINCFVHVKSSHEADWWLQLFGRLQQAYLLEKGGPQLMLSLCLYYRRSRLTWLLPWQSDLTRFFRKKYPFAFSNTHAGIARPRGPMARRLASVTREDILQWLNEPEVRRRIVRIERRKFFKPFERSHELPMSDVLEHLRGVLREHPA
jgi:hypothetical protein